MKAKYKITVRIEVSPSVESYAPAGLATVTERVVEADGFMEIAETVQPIIELVESLGVPVRPK